MLKGAREKRLDSEMANAKLNGGPVWSLREGTIRHSEDSKVI